MKLQMPKILASAPGAPILNPTSPCYKISPVRFDDYNFTDGKEYDPWSGYGRYITDVEKSLASIDPVAVKNGIRATPIAALDPTWETRKLSQQLRPRRLTKIKELMTGLPRLEGKECDLTLQTLYKVIDESVSQEESLAKYRVPGPDAASNVLEQLAYL
ncbi:hypothetical protein AYL99_09302 [Fonsecaea erecta]|uniref:Uncharacterized protein n=1 Tax=Fonsecaea erecta TaxID=1367422 RepID=A0A178ZA78_9EURO|nr:hypothetical protein AYL99_09302 [Fonsecaea erecta]OAP56123.1 hypothetical protein AYL99_09302 [Fonsecaea erecta]